MEDSVAHFAALGYRHQSGNPADFFIEVCFGMVPGEQHATRVENIGRAWMVKAMRAQERAQKRSSYALKESSDIERKQAARSMLRLGFLRELKTRAPHAHLNSTFKGARFVEVVYAERARVERENALQSIDKATWIKTYWEPNFGGMMGNRLRDQLWTRATERAKRLRGHRRASRQVYAKLAKYVGAAALMKAFRVNSDRSVSSSGRCSEGVRSGERRYEDSSARLSVSLPSSQRSSESDESEEDGSSPKSSALTSSCRHVSVDFSTPPTSPGRQRSVSDDAASGSSATGSRFSAFARTTSLRMSRMSAVASSLMGRAASFSHAVRVNPTLADLQYEMHNWHLDARAVPGWGRHFRVCLKRGAKKLIRRRNHLYAKFLSVFLAAVVCGLVCYVLKQDRNMLAIIYMLCNALFATLVATGSIDVLGNREERELLAHEAASGVRPSAEALARVLLDVLVLLPLSPIFALPLSALSNMPIGTWPLVFLYGQVAWAMATFGYVFSLISPANATLLTAAITLILFAFFSGCLIGPSFLPDGAHLIFWLNPGFASFLQIGLGNAIRMPFSLNRWALIQLFMESNILPQEPAEVQIWEYDQWVWLLPSLMSLLACGTLLRVVAVSIFSLREVHFNRTVRWRRYCAESLCVCRRHTAFDETPVPLMPSTPERSVALGNAELSRSLDSQGVIRSPESSILSRCTDDTTPQRSSSCCASMMRQRAGAKTWAVDPEAAAPTGTSSDTVPRKVFTVELPLAFVASYTYLLAIRSEYPKAITTALPSGARLTFTPHPLMKGGDLVQFQVPSITLVPRPKGVRNNSTEIVYSVDSFTVRSARIATDVDREAGVHSMTPFAAEASDPTPESTAPSTSNANAPPQHSVSAAGAPSNAPPCYRAYSSTL